MKPADITIGSTYTNGTQERLVVSWCDQYRGGAVVYRVVSKRGGGPLRVGNESVMSKSGFAAWAQERVEVTRP